MRPQNLLLVLTGVVVDLAIGISGFHAPQEAARILGESIDASCRGQVALRMA